MPVEGDGAEDVIDGRVVGVERDRLLEGLVRLAAQVQLDADYPEQEVNAGIGGLQRAGVGQVTERALEIPLSIRDARELDERCRAWEASGECALESFPGTGQIARVRFRRPEGTKRFERCTRAAGQPFQKHESRVARGLFSNAGTRRITSASFSAGSSVSRRASVTARAVSPLPWRAATRTAATWHCDNTCGGNRSSVVKPSPNAPELVSRNASCRPPPRSTARSAASGDRRRSRTPWRLAARRLVPDRAVRGSRRPPPPAVQARWRVGSGPQPPPPLPAVPRRPPPDCAGSGLQDTPSAPRILSQPRPTDSDCDTAA